MVIIVYNFVNEYQSAISVDAFSGSDENGQQS